MFSWHIKPIIKLLDDNDKLVRLTAIRALGRIGSTRAIKALARTLKSDGNETRIEVAHVLGNTNKSKALRPLTEALKDEDESMRRAAIRALAGVINRQQELSNFKFCRW